MSLDVMADRPSHSSRRPSTRPHTNSVIARTANKIHHVRRLP